MNDLFFSAANGRADDRRRHRRRQGALGVKPRNSTWRDARFLVLLPLALVAVAVNKPLFADPSPIRSAEERYANIGHDETPDFQKHVAPLLGRLGCNGRSCHGAFSGQGGFQLSLFGYDFAMDHANLLDRVDLDSPAESYVLLKPTLAEPHEGGERIKPKSWEYHLFLKWIEGGAPGVQQPAKLLELEVLPREIQFTHSGQQRQLRAVAIWEDGTREDVTCLSRFQTNDDSICEVDADGMVTSVGPGDSHVVVFYDKAVVPIPVLRPVSEHFGQSYPRIAAKTDIDRAVIGKLQKLGIIPSQICDDSEFLRRVSLDLAGTLPTAAEVRAFLADTSLDKRARKIDELLQTEAYAAWWTVRLSDWTGCNEQDLNGVKPTPNWRGSQDWYDWLYKRVSENVPYDQIMEGIVLAVSRAPGESYQEYSARMSRHARGEDGGFAALDGLTHWWGRRNFNLPEERAIGFAYTFMGTRIQCAQCHKHPYDIWSQKDFQEFSHFFSRLTYARVGNAINRDGYQALLEALKVDDLKGKERSEALERLLHAGETIPFPELVVQPPGWEAQQRKRKKDAPPEPEVTFAKLLGEETVNVAEIDDPRSALMDWLRNSPTRLFAKAFVNRTWANYFGRGIVEPTDDLSLANPPSNEALLNVLVEGFLASGYDMKWLHKEICLSDTYQRSWRPNETNAQDERNFSRSIPRRIPAEAAYDALLLATANDQVAAAFRTDIAGRGVASATPVRNAAGEADYALTVFGRSSRSTSCDCDRSSEPNLPQTLYLRNDNDALALLDRRDGWLHQLLPHLAGDETGVAAETDPEQAVDELPVDEPDSAEGDSAQQIGSDVEDFQGALEATHRACEGDSYRAVTPAEMDVDGVIEEAYLRTVSRYPTTRERELAAKHVAAAESEWAGIRDLLWALINTKEFLVNH